MIKSNPITLHQVALKTRRGTECSRIRPRASNVVVEGPDPIQSTKPKTTIITIIAAALPRSTNYKPSKSVPSLAAGQDNAEPTIERSAQVMK